MPTRHATAPMERAATPTQQAAPPTGTWVMGAAKQTQTGPTLLDILRRPNPPIHNRWTGVSYTNTISGTGSFDDIELDSDHPNTVQRWVDFNFDAIKLAYGDLLAQHISEFRGKIPELSNYQQVDDPPLTPTIIHDEGDLDTLGIVWMCPIIRGPIKAAAHVLRARQGMASSSTTSATIAAKKVGWKVPKKPNTRMKPDWYASVPWSATGKDGLTANLAIWALGCMAMNDRHRAMEGPNHTPLKAMARLTWWQHNGAKKFYENVISKRRIAEKDWRPEYNHLVRLDDTDGQSFTSTFVTSSSVPKVPGSATPSKGAVDDLTKSMQGMKLGSGSGAASSSNPGPSASTKPVAAFKTCVIGKETYTLHMKGDKYFVYLDDKKKQVAWIKKDDKNKFTVEIEKKTRAVKMLP